MTLTTGMYTVYLIVSLFITLLVAGTLHRYGALFLVDVFGGNRKIAEAVNALLVVGFCLINFAFVVSVLRYSEKPETLLDVCDILGSKIGLAMLVLGVMHFGNLFIFAQIKQWYCRARPLEIVDFDDC